MFSKYNLRDVVKWLAITCVTCFLIGFAMIFARINDYSRLSQRSWNEDIQVVDEKNAGTMDGVGEIKIKTGSVGINVLKSDSKDIKAVLSGFSGGAVVSSDYKLTADRSRGANGDIIDIRIDGGSFIVMGASYYKLDVYVPADYAKTIEATSVSGSIKIQGYGLSRMAIDSSSGSINAGLVKADEMEIKTVSGSITLDDTTADSFTVNSSSGSLRLEGLNIRSSINAATTSGSVRIGFKEFSGKAYIRSSSGSCRVDFPNNADLLISASSSSGSVSCGLPLKGNSKQHGIDGTVNGGKNTVEVRTSSGSIKIE